MSAVGKLAQRTLTRVHVRLYELSGGSLGGRMGKAPVLLLHTTGRRSGRRRTTPLLYLADDDHLIVVASNGGSPRHPAWYLNLQANPESAVQVRRERRPVQARDATPDERERYWPQLLAIYKWYASYERKTSRRIPVVVLERR